jgi:hypothetical protein
MWPKRPIASGIDPFYQEWNNWFNNDFTGPMCQESIIISTSIHEVKASGIARVPLFFML